MRLQRAAAGEGLQQHCAPAPGEGTLLRRHDGPGPCPAPAEGSCPIFEIRIPDFHNTRSPSVSREMGCWDCLQTMPLPRLQQQGTPACLRSSWPPRACITFQCLVCSLQNIKDNFSELLEWLQEKQKVGQGMPDSGMEAGVANEWEKRGLLHRDTLCWRQRQEAAGLPFSERDLSAHRPGGAGVHPARVNPTRCRSYAAQTSTELLSHHFQLQLRHSAGCVPSPWPRSCLHGTACVAR